MTYWGYVYHLDPAIALTLAFKDPSGLPVHFFCPSGGVVCERRL